MIATAPPRMGYPLATMLDLAGLIDGRSTGGPVDARPATCPLTQRQLIDAYFIENRTRLLDIAAFLDRLDRARELDASDDFRLAAFRDALRALSDDAPRPAGTSSRIDAVQAVFSDPTTELLPQLDRKSAFGAYGGRRPENGANVEAR